jgi:hypothetical protein
MTTSHMISGDLICTNEGEKYLDYREFCRHAIIITPKIVPVSLAQLVGISHYICRSPGSNPRHSTYSRLKVDFLATRLLDNNKNKITAKIIVRI